MAQSQLIEEIIEGTGKFDNKKQYAFTNWFIPKGENAPRDFAFKWNGEEYLVKAGEIAVYPQYLAYHACKHYVNYVMLSLGQEVMFLNADQRRVYEDKTIREVTPNGEDPFVSSIREQERMKLMAEMGLDSSADLGITNSETRRHIIEDSAKMADVAATPEKKKAGRPKKEFAGANGE